jgi:hypothetical protein
MTRIIEHRQNAAPGEELLELRVFQLRFGDVRACVVCGEVAIDLDMMADMSAPAAQAYLNALALCETEGVATLWVHDPLGLFPPSDRRGGHQILHTTSPSRTAMTLSHIICDDSGETTIT